MLTELQEADCLLDSFPFSGFNSLVDALSLSLPVICLRSPGLSGGLGAAVMESLNCAEECVATSPEEYITKAVRLSRDPLLRLDLRQRLSLKRVLRVLSDPAIGAHFAAAVEWMRSEGPGSRGAPVLIEAGEAPRLLAG